MGERINIRELITDMLISIDRGESKSHLILRDVLDKYNYLDSKDKAFIRRVTMGVLERKITLDYYINIVSNTKTGKMKPFIRNLIRMSVYQIIYMDKIPDSAACNEAVKLAQGRGFGNLSGFINGVLRTVSREKDTFTLPDEGKNIMEYLTVRYSCPELIISSLIRDYGLEETRSILDISLRKRNLYVRVREGSTEDKLEHIKEEWHDNGIGFERSPYYKYAYMITQGDRLAELEYFKRGYYTIQDISSMLVGVIADIDFSGFVVDLCGAPGGKTMHIADKMLKSRKESKTPGFMGEILCRDLSPAKVSLILDNINRMQLKFIKVEEWDASLPDSNLYDKADLVILDIPCSGIGVMGKKPDIKYNLTMEGMESLEKLQRSIIDNAVRYVKPGGELIYSTCTLRYEENQSQIEYILDNYDFHLEDISDRIPEALKHRIKNKGMIELMPRDNCDGFFIGKLRRNGH